jgi:hypothetical protein
VFVVKPGVRFTVVGVNKCPYLREIYVGGTVREINVIF